MRYETMKLCCKRSVGTLRCDGERDLSHIYRKKCAREIIDIPHCDVITCETIALYAIRC